MATTADILNATREAILSDPKVIDTAFSLHPVMDLLWKNKRSLGTGTSIDFRVVTQRPGNLAWYSGTALPATTDNDILAPGTLPWRKAAYSVVIPGDNSIQNRGEEAIVDLAEETIKGAMTDLVEDLATAFYTQSGAGNNPHGLPAVEDATNPYAGIDPGVAATATWDIVTQSAAAGPLTVELVNRVMNELHLNGAKISHISVSEPNYRWFQSLPTYAAGNIQRTYETSSGKDMLNLATPDRLFYGKAEVILDPNCTDAIAHFHDFRNFHLYISDDPNRKISMSEWKFMQWYDRTDRYMSELLFAGNFVCRARHHQGTITNIVP